MSDQKGFTTTILHSDRLLKPELVPYINLFIRLLPGDMMMCRVC
jgi:hypothetical protein